MVKPRASQNWILKELARVEEEHPVIAEKWAVEEVTPAYNTGGYYDEDIPERAVVVSPRYDTREEAEEWMSKHVADKGKYLAVAKFIAREYTYVTWTRTRVK